MTKTYEDELTRDDLLLLSERSGGTAVDGALAVVLHAASIAHIQAEVLAKGHLAFDAEQRKDAINTLAVFVSEHGASVDARFDHDLYLAVEADPAALFNIRLPESPKAGHVSGPLDALKVCLAIGAKARSEEIQGWKWKVCSSIAAWLIEKHGAEIEAMVKSPERTPAMAMGA